MFSYFTYTLIWPWSFSVSLSVRALDRDYAYLLLPAHNNFANNPKLANSNMDTALDLSDASKALDLDNIRFQLM